MLVRMTGVLQGVYYLVVHGRAGREHAVLDLPAKSVLPGGCLPTGAISMTSSMTAVGCSQTNELPESLCRMQSP